MDRHWQNDKDISSSSHTPFTEDLVRKRQRPRSHFMPVDVFGTPLHAGSAPRDQGARKDHDCCVARRMWMWMISLFVFLGCIGCIRMGRVVVKARWEVDNRRHTHSC